MQAANNALAASGGVQRVPSAQRLTPLQPAAQAAKEDESEGPDLNSMSREELRKLTLALKKETDALKQQYEVLSGSGKQGSTEGIQSSQAGPRSPSPPVASTQKSPRPSGVTFAQQPAGHRNSVLVVEFDNRKRSSVVQTVDQFR